MQVRDAPYLELDDVRDIVAVVGGALEIWTMLVRLTCGGGHPRLVGAHVAWVAKKQWPAGERLNGFGIGDGRSEVADVRREVSLRLLDELSADAHLLLLRLSGLIGSFDLRLIDAVAAIDPLFQRASPLFDQLVGPWIRNGADRSIPAPATAAIGRGIAERCAAHYGSRRRHRSC